MRELGNFFYSAAFFTEKILPAPSHGLSISGRRFFKTIHHSTLSSNTRNFVLNSLIVANCETKERRINKIICLNETNFGRIIIIMAKIMYDYF
jgi:hypothetical protein